MLYMCSDSRGPLEEEIENHRKQEHDLNSIKIQNPLKVKVTKFIGKLCEMNFQVKEPR